MKHGSIACGGGIRHSWFALSVLLRLLGMDLKRRIQEEMNWEVPLAKSTQRFGGQSPGKPVMCRVLDRDEPVVALYLPATHPLPLAIYIYLLETHRASVGQELRQCFGAFVTQCEYLPQRGRSIFDTAPCDPPPFGGTRAEENRGHIWRQGRSSESSQATWKSSWD